MRKGPEGSTFAHGLAGKTCVRVHERAPSRTVITVSEGVITNKSAWRACPRRRCGGTSEGGRRG